MSLLLLCFITIVLNVIVTKYKLSNLKIMRCLFVIAIFLLLSSCSAMVGSSNVKNGMIKNSSVFANVNELGLSKAAFISKYGNPINKDVFNEGTDLIENLYYVESIDQVLVTTKIKFINDKVVEQSNYKIEYNTNKQIKKLQDRVWSAEMDAFMSQMKP